MRFSHDYSKLQDRLFTTIRAGDFYGEGQLLDIRTPTRRFWAKVLFKTPVRFKEIPEPLLQYDTDSPDLSGPEIIKKIQGLYRNDPPDANDVVTIYVLKKED